MLGITSLSLLARAAPRNKSSSCVTACARYQLYITIVEARQLEAMDANGSSDPYVRCTLDLTGESKETSHQEKTLNPIFEEDMVFEFEIENPFALFAASLKIECMDSDILYDEVIGVFQMELGVVWHKSKDHMLRRQWVALMDSTLKRPGPQGSPGRHRLSTLPFAAIP